MLAQLGNLSVVETVARSIGELVQGEVLQMYPTAISSSRSNSQSDRDNDDDEEDADADGVEAASMDQRARRDPILFDSRAHMSQIVFQHVPRAQMDHLATRDPTNGREWLEEQFEIYLRKTYMKTASLMAKCCQASFQLHDTTHTRTSNPSSPTSSLEDKSYDAHQFGKHLGTAFQLMDDLLDFEQSTSTLGKPAGSDVHLGLATAPVLYASLEFPDLVEFMGGHAVQDHHHHHQQRRRDGQPGSRINGDEVIRLVRLSQGQTRTRELAAHHAREARKWLDRLCPEENEYKRALAELTEKVLTRRK